MLEKAAGKNWTQLLEVLNTKYEIETIIGFPNQESNGTFGHRKKLFKYKAISNAREYKFRFDLSPSGNLSLNILDLSFFIKHHFDGLNGKANILKEETYHKMHFGLEKYSLGWYNGNIGNTELKFSYHGGSIGTFSSAIMISPERQVAIIILINSDNKKTSELKTQLRTLLWEKFGKNKKDQQAF